MAARMIRIVSYAHAILGLTGSQLPNDMARIVMIVDLG